MSIFSQLKNYFNEPATIRRGTRALAFIIVLLLFSQKFYLYFRSGDSKTDVEFEAMVNKFYTEQEKLKHESSFADNYQLQNDFSVSVESDSANTHKKIVQLFSFDPNTATENDFQKLGLNAKTIKSILNYRSKKGKFYSPEDFKKIYTLSESDYNRLKDFIVIEKNNTVQKIYADYKKQEPEAPLRLEINLADSISLLRLQGIGPFLTSKILKYRKALGGFYSVNQIAEVYGMKIEVFDSIRGKLFFDVENKIGIKKLNLNLATQEQLNAHPYISFKQAQVIVNYRTQHGNYKKIEDLKQTEIFSAAEFEKLSHYLTAVME